MEALTLDHLQGIKSDFMAMADKETFVREANFAMQIYNGSSQLQKCDFESTLAAIKNVAAINLTLNPALGLCYIVPRYINKKMVACLEPSYQGLVKLVTDSGSIDQVYAHLVMEGDEFDYKLGLNPDVHHKPMNKSKKITHVYAVAIMHNGRAQIEVMTKEEVEYIRNSSESYKAYKANKIRSCVWVQHPGEMFRKTVIKRLCKYLTKTERWEHVAKAIELSNMDFKASYEQVQMIENLLMNANIEPEMERAIYQEVQSGITSDRASELIQDLQENQVDRVQEGTSTKAEINQKVKDIIGE